MTGVACALSLQTIEPRAFGYTVGDVLQRRVVLDPNRDGTLDPASLPHPGRSGRWFQLREVASAPGAVTLVYQIVNTPEQPDRENLPSLSLRVVAKDGRVLEANIGPFTVAMTPVVHFGPYEQIQMTDLRPDIAPAPIDTSARRGRIFAYAAALLALLAVQALRWLARRPSWRRAMPFARVSRALRRLSAQGDDVPTRCLALRSLHQALDQAAGVTLALDNLDTLFQAHPALESARAPVQALLAASRAAFFGQAPPPSLHQLSQWAGRLAELEAQEAR
jgi:mxaA protein